MQQDENLLRLDDFMFRGATCGAAVVALGVVVALAWPEGAAISRGGVFGLVAFASIAPIGMLVLGLALRKRERRAVGLMRLMERHVEVSAEDLLANSEFDEATLETAIRDLNSSGRRHVVWDRKTKLIQDGWLRRSRLHVETCSSCGTKISLDVALHEAADARCPSCDASLDAREVDDEKQSVMSEISEQARPRPVPVERGWRFSIPIFLVLLVVCWPIAMIYALKCFRPIACEGAPVPSCGPFATPGPPPLR
jgi:hypothetical protein